MAKRKQVKSPATESSEIKTRRTSPLSDSSFDIADLSAEIMDQFMDILKNQNSLFKQVLDSQNQKVVEQQNNLLKQMMSRQGEILETQNRILESTFRLLENCGNSNVCSKWSASAGAGKSPLAADIDLNAQLTKEMQRRDEADMRWQKKNNAVIMNWPEKELRTTNEEVFQIRDIFEKCGGDPTHIDCVYRMGTIGKRPRALKAYMGRSKCPGRGRLGFTITL